MSAVCHEVDGAIGEDLGCIPPIKVKIVVNASQCVKCMSTGPYIQYIMFEKNNATRLIL